MFIKLLQICSWIVVSSVKHLCSQRSRVSSACTILINFCKLNLLIDWNIWNDDYLFPGSKSPPSSVELWERQDRRRQCLSSNPSAVLLGVCWLPLDAHVEPSPCGYSQLLLLGLSCTAKWAGPKRVCLLTIADSQSNIPWISFDSLYLLRKALLGNAPQMATCRSVQSLCSAAWDSLIGAGRSTFLGRLASTWLQINIDPLHLCIVWYICLVKCHSRFSWNPVNVA